MPKANAKDVYYFSHDCNARNDEKILAMRSVYGLEGYAMFFMIVEIMREQNEYKLEMNKYIWSTLAMQMHRFFMQMHTISMQMHSKCSANVIQMHL